MTFQTATEFLSSLAKEGGVIVSTGECSAEEIVFAKAESRFFADHDGMGYVRRPVARQKTESGE